MNIHVFYVNRGDMLMFDMAFSVESVTRLQEVICKDTDISPENQVLLISGGEMMQPSSRVYNYSAGTDTNPIFLFNLKAIEEKSPPEISREIDQPDIRHRIEGSLTMGPTLATLTTRTQLALELRDLARKHEELCRSLVHDQHLQHQGWSTVVANLEDTRQAFVDKTDKFSDWYCSFVNCKQEKIDMLTSFPQSVEILSNMPILTPLTQVLSRSVYQGLVGDAQLPQTIMQLLNTLDKDHNLLEEAMNSLDELKQLDKDFLVRLMDEKEKVLETADNSTMKEVKGLEDRLFGLEQLIANASKLVKDQEAYAQGFVQNQNRFRQLADHQILADLCASHREQLRAMEGCDYRLRQIVFKCMETKRELSTNLHTRLRWIMYVEKKISSLDCKFDLYYKNFHRLKNHIDKLDQIYRAPVVYAKLCSEVCRRRTFSQNYTKVRYSKVKEHVDITVGSPDVAAVTWGHDTYTRSSELHEKEVEHRRSFYKAIGPHFLKTFFPGLDKLPPALMVTSPQHMDDDLPAIDNDDITSLQQRFPELKEHLRMPDPDDSIIQSGTTVDQCQSQANSSIAVLSPRAVSSDSQQSDSCRPLPSTSSNALESDGLGQTDTQSVHLMAPCKPLSYDDDFSSATDDDQAPDSHGDDHSGGFTTANFFLSGELESINPSNNPSASQMAVTITMQNSEIEKLCLDNTTLKNRFDNLCNLVEKLRGVVSRESQGFQESQRVVMSDMHEYEKQFLSLKEQLLNATQTSVSFWQQETDKQKSLLAAEYEVQIKCNMKKMDTLESENAHLLQKLDDIQRRYDGLQAEMKDYRSEYEKNMADAVHQTRENVTKQITLEHELELDRLEQQHKDDMVTKDAEITRLDKDIRQLRESLDEAHAKHQATVEQLSNKHDTELSSQIDNLRQLHAGEIKNLTTEFEKGLQRVHMEADSEKLAALNALEASMNAKHEQAIQGMTKVKCDAETNTDLDIIRRGIIDEMEVQNELAVAQAISEVEAKHKDQLATQEKEFESRAATMKESIQTVFEVRLNERLTQARKEKDSVIAELRRQLQGKSLQTPNTMSRSMSESVMTMSHTDVSPADQKLAEKDSIIKSLEAKLEQVEMSASSRELVDHDKVSVRSVNRGDKVIMCFDERHNHYVVFTIGNVMHFLHSDSLKDMGLSSTDDGKNPSWILAEVTDKEYCQARKPNNRFRVDVGTKFYRVKAKQCFLK